MDLPGPWNIEDYGKDDSLEECVAETAPLSVNELVSLPVTQVTVPVTQVVGNIRLRVLNPSQLSPIQRSGVHNLPNIHGIQHRQQAPRQVQKMSRIEKNAAIRDGKIRQLCQTGVIGRPPGQGIKVRARMTSQFSEASRPQHQPQPQYFTQPQFSSPVPGPKQKLKIKIF